MEISKIFLVEEYNEKLSNIIENSYFSDNSMGKLNRKVEFSLDKGSMSYKMLDGDGNDYVKASSDIIDGSMRFFVNRESDTIKLLPESMFCVKNEEGKYSFY